MKLVFHVTRKSYDRLKHKYRTTEDHLVPVLLIIFPYGYEFSQHVEWFRLSDFMIVIYTYVSFQRRVKLALGYTAFISCQYLKAMQSIDYWLNIFQYRYSKCLSDCYQQ